MAEKIQQAKELRSAVNSPEYEDAKNVCGVSPFFLTLKLVGPVEGEQAGYAICPADAVLSRGAGMIPAERTPRKRI